MLLFASLAGRQRLPQSREPPPGKSTTAISLSWFNVLVLSARWKEIQQASRRFAACDLSRIPTACVIAMDRITHPPRITYRPRSTRVLRLSLLRALRTVLLIGISGSVAVTSVIAQSSNKPGAPAKDGNAMRADLAFDVVSIRPDHSGPEHWHVRVVPGGDQYEAFGTPLGQTILMAYFPYSMGSRDHLVGAPDWVWNDRYDFVGKVGEADLPDWRTFSERGFMVPNPMLQSMLQHALADRLKLTVHRVPVQIDGYALVVAKHETRNLAESRPDDAIPDLAQKLPLDARMVPILSSNDPVVHFYQTSMAAFALQLSLMGLTPVVDRTGLGGRYRFDLMRLGTEGIQSSDWNLAPLGLRLVPTKIPSYRVVIDHVERPSPN
jgi:uncharacterized protein (TIGR03435 family)